MSLNINELDKDEVDELWADGFAMEKYMAEKEWDEEKEKYQEEFCYKFERIKRQLVIQYTQLRLKLVNKSLKYMRELLEQLYVERTAKLDNNLEKTHKALQAKLYENWCQEKAYAKNQFKKQIAKFEILEKEKGRAREMERLTELDNYRHELEKEWRQRFTAAFHSWDSYVKNNVEIDLNEEWDLLKNKAILFFRESLDKSLKEFVSEETDQEVIFREQTTYLREWVLGEYDKLRWKTLSTLEHSASHAHGEFEIERADKVKDFFATWTDSDGDLRMWEKRRMEALAEFKKDRDKIIHQAEMGIDVIKGAEFPQITDIYAKFMKNLNDPAQIGKDTDKKQEPFVNYIPDSYPRDLTTQKVNPETIKPVSKDVTSTITEQVMSMKTPNLKSFKNEMPLDFNLDPGMVDPLLTRASQQPNVSTKFSKDNMRDDKELRNSLKTELIIDEKLIKNEKIQDFPRKSLKKESQVEKLIDTKIDDIVSTTSAKRESAKPIIESKPEPETKSPRVSKRKTSNNLLIEQDLVINNEPVKRDNSIHPQMDELVKPRGQSLKQSEVEPSLVSLKPNNEDDKEKSGKRGIHLDTFSDLSIEESPINSKIQFPNDSLTLDKYDNMMSKNKNSKGNDFDEFSSDNSSRTSKHFIGDEFGNDVDQKSISMENMESNSQIQ